MLAPTAGELEADLARAIEQCRSLKGKVTHADGLRLFREFGFAPLARIFGGDALRRGSGVLIGVGVLTKLNSVGSCINETHTLVHQKLDEMIQDEIKQFLETSVLPALSAHSGEALMVEFALRWRQHKLMTRVLHKMFCFRKCLSQSVAHFTPGASTTTISVRLFKSVVFDGVRSKLAAAVGDVIGLTRSRQLADTSLIRSTAELINVMGLLDNKALTFKTVKHMLKVLREPDSAVENETYYSYFEKPFLIHSKEYFDSISASWVGTMDCPSYLRKATELLADENDRASTFLNQSTLAKLMDVVASAVTAPMPFFLDQPVTGLGAMLRNAQVSPMFSSAAPQDSRTAYPSARGPRTHVHALRPRRGRPRSPGRRLP